MFPTLTLVGSTKFPNVWKEQLKCCTLDGYIVHTVGLFGHVENLDMSGKVKHMLDEMYQQKIFQSDSIFVLNTNGYIGMGAWDEILFALAYDKHIYFLESEIPYFSDLCNLAKLEDKEYLIHNCKPPHLRS